MARLAAPTGVVLAKHPTRGKSLYISDAGSHTIRRYWLGAVTAGHVRVETPWGAPWKPGLGEGTGTGAAFDSPAGLVMVPLPNTPGEALVVADQGNHVLRKIDITSAAVSDSPVSTFIGDPSMEGQDDGWAAAREIGVPSGLACRNGKVYVDGVGFHEINPVTGGVRTLSPLDLSGSVAATQDAFFGTSLYGIVEIDLITLAKRNFSFSAQRNVTILGASLDYVYTVQEVSDSLQPTQLYATIPLAPEAAFAALNFDTAHGGFPNSGAFWNGHLYYGINERLYRVQADTSISAFPLTPELVAEPSVSGSGFGPVGEFAIDDDYVYSASGTTVKRRPLPTNPANALGAADASFYTPAEFEGLNGSICLEGTNLYVGDNGGDIHHIDRVSGAVNTIAPDFEIEP
jgi:hypothetical protein